MLSIYYVGVVVRAPFSSLEIPLSTLGLKGSDILGLMGREQAWQIGSFSFAEF